MNTKSQYTHFPHFPYFSKGMMDGIPIALGYLSVSFGFGITAVRADLSVLTATVISLCNLTSAGQAAGVAIMAAGGSFVEMALTQLVINLRYGLMSLSLSQKLDESFNTPRRLLVSYGITDEIFAMASSKEGKLSPHYMYGLILIAALCWTLGTFLGAAAGQLLPASLTSAMGLMLYAMFIAIIIPPAAEKKSVLLVVIIASALSVVCRYLLPFLSGGFAVIICGIAAALIGALFFPVREEENA